MKIQLSYIFCLFFSCLAAHLANAQDAGMQDVEMTTIDVVERDRIISAPGEGSRYTPRTSPTTLTNDKDLTGTSQTSNNSSAPASANTAPVTKTKAEKPSPAPKTPVEKQSKEKDDSILSYNFLYYIIEKYKLQDIID